ncbi:MAG: hypothetical protein QM479_17010 [Pseudomonadota bacterium]
MLIRLFLIIFLLCLATIINARPQNNFSLGQAVEQVKQQQHGKILSATTRRDKQQRNIHNIRVLTPHGKVKRYQFNEANGQYIRPHQR